MNRNNFFVNWSKLHGGAHVTGIVRAWLTISYFLVKPLQILRITPSTVSLIGLVAGVFTWLESGKSWGIALLIVSLVADGIDGSLAIITNQTSAWGAELDSVIDRLVEFFWALAFIKLGAPVVVVGIAWSCAITQEYVRARAGGVGYRNINVVTICERPVRASLLFVAMVAYLIPFQIITEIAWVWLVMQAYSLVVVLRDSYAALQSDN